MSIQNSQNLTLEAALKLLKTFSCNDAIALDSETEKNQLRQALKMVVDLSDSQNLGICADNAQQALQTLKQYLIALEYPTLKEYGNIPIDTPIYLKFNTQKMSYYIDSYTGHYRGVLVACQSSENDNLAGTYGHFPLDLFANESKA